MRSIAEAAKAAVSGTEEPIWHAAWENLESEERQVYLNRDRWADREIILARGIHRMKSEERSLYGISNE